MRTTLLLLISPPFLVSPVTTLCSSMALSQCLASAVFFGGTGCSWRLHPSRMITPLQPPIAAHMAAINARSRLIPPVTDGLSLTSALLLKATCFLRWRLCPGDWRLDGSSAIGPMATLHIDCDQPITKLELVSGWESRYYGAKEQLVVLEVSVRSGSCHSHYLHSAFCLISPAREGSLLPPVLLNP